MIADALTLLPEPLSPRIDQRLAAVQVAARRSRTAWTVPARAAELDREIVDLEQVRVAWPRHHRALQPPALQRVRRRSAARTASRLTASVVSMMARPGKKASHQAVAR